MHTQTEIGTEVAAPIQRGEMQYTIESFHLLYWTIPAASSQHAHFPGARDNQFGKLFYHPGHRS